jgi:D-aminopeptidase
MGLKVRKARQGGSPGEHTGAPMTARLVAVLLASLSLASLNGPGGLSGPAAAGPAAAAEMRARARDVGIAPGVLPPGRWNAITDVAGVRVGHTTIVRGEDVRTGVTAILPHGDNVFLAKVPAAIWVGNGFGKLAGTTQVAELGQVETPIVLTNTLSVGTAMTAVVQYVLGLPGCEEVRSVNAVVGETNDGWLNDIRGLHVDAADVRAAILAAKGGRVAEGAVGAGTGTVAFGWKGGIGTSSRQVEMPRTGGGGIPSGGSPDTLARYTVGVLVQSNYGGRLTILGIPVAEELSDRRRRSADRPGDGSCMIVVATDAPLSSRNLRRLAARAPLGLARTGSVMSNGSGDYVIAFSTAYRIPYASRAPLAVPPLLPNDAMTPLFQAVVEATEEAVYNSLLMSSTMRGRGGHEARALPVELVTEILQRHGVLED